MNTKSIFQSIQQGVLICDKRANILYFNKAYENFIGKPLSEIKGKPITEFRKGTIIPNVILSGIPIEGVLRKENNQEYFASVYPIIEEDSIQGSISIVTTIEHTKLTQNKKSLEERVKDFERKEIRYLMSIYGEDLKGKKLVAKELKISLATLYNKLNEK